MFYNRKEWLQAVTSSFKIRNILDTGDWIERGRLVCEGIKSLWSVEAGTEPTDAVDLPICFLFVLSLYHPFSICSPTLTFLSPAPLPLHLLSLPFSSVTLTWNRRIQFLQALGSEGKASINQFINDDHFPTEKKVLKLKHKCIDSLFLIIHCRCSAVLYHCITAANLSVNS